jgi:hypothetical protein
VAPAGDFSPETTITLRASESMDAIFVLPQSFNCEENCSTLFKVALELVRCLNVSVECIGRVEFGGACVTSMID